MVLSLEEPAVREACAHPAELQFDAVFDHAPIGMSVFGSRLQRLRVNRAFSRMVGYTQAELLELGKHDITHPDDVPGEALRLASLLAGSEPFSIEKRYLHKDGSVVWAHVTFSAVRDAQGRTLYVVAQAQAQAQDVTPRRLAAEQHRALETQQLAAAHKELESFAYSIAHDLRAPLSSIDGFSHMLGEAAGDALPPRARHYLSRIRAGVRRMSELTDGLLSLANYSRTPLRWEGVDLAALARNALDELQQREPQRTVDIVVPESLPVQGDARLLARLVGHLVGNAWKFTRRQPQARIEVACETGDDGRTVYCVKDNGAGFDMAHATRLFEAFQRMHTPAEFEGTGIGLALAQRIVTRHGGRIWAHAAPGEGACFRFVLGNAPAFAPA